MFYLCNLFEIKSCYQYDTKRSKNQRHMRELNIFSTFFLYSMRIRFLVCCRFEVYCSLLKVSKNWIFLANNYNIQSFFLTRRLILFLSSALFLLFLFHLKCVWSVLCALHLLKCFFHHHCDMFYLVFTAVSFNRPGCCVCARINTIRQLS